MAYSPTPVCNTSRLLTIVASFYFLASKLASIPDTTAPIVSNDSACPRHTAYALIITASGRYKTLRLPAKGTLAMLICLATSGDIELNPGPKVPKYPCGMCSKAVRPSDPAVSCDQCGFWVHNRCSGLSKDMYSRMKSSDGV
jgi:hypothetical protein